MALNEFGKIIKKQWVWLAKQYSYVYLDEYVIMPNHIHGIIGICREQINIVETGRDLSLQLKIKSLSELIGAFKTTSSKLIRQNGLSDFRWQRSFYDHIIRNAKSLEKIRKYIYYNPVKEEYDRNNSENLFM